MDIQTFHSLPGYFCLVQSIIGVVWLIIFHGVDEGDLAVDNIVVVHCTVASYKFNDLVFVFV